MEHIHPDLMATEEILGILEERKLEIKDIRSLARDELLKIFNKFAMPLGRRERGKSITSRKAEFTETNKTSRKRILPPTQDELEISKTKCPRVALKVCVNGAQKRPEPIISTDQPGSKRKKITWP